METNMYNLTQQITLTKSDEQPWGFRINGGADFGTPLTVIKVYGGSIAEEAGLQVGDVLLGINDKPITDFYHQEAYEALINAGNSFTLRMIRGSCFSPPPPGVTVDEKYMEDDTQACSQAVSASEGVYEEESEKIYGLDAIIAAILSQGLASEAATELETFNAVHENQELEQQFEELSDSVGKQASNSEEHVEAAQVKESHAIDGTINYQHIDQQLETETIIATADAIEFETFNEINDNQATEQQLQDISHVQMEQTSTREERTKVALAIECPTVGENVSIGHQCNGQLKNKSKVTKTNMTEFETSNNIHINQDQKQKYTDPNHAQIEETSNKDECTQAAKPKENCTIDNNLVLITEPTTTDTIEAETSNKVNINQSAEQKLEESGQILTEKASNTEQHTEIAPTKESPAVDKMFSIEQLKTETKVIETNTKESETSNNVHINQNPQQNCETTGIIQTEQVSNIIEHTEAAKENGIYTVDKTLNVDQECVQDQSKTESTTTEANVTEVDVSNKVQISQDAEQNCGNPGHIEAETASVIEEHTEVIQAKESPTVDENVATDLQCNEQSQNQTMKTKPAAEQKPAEESVKGDIGAEKQQPKSKKEKQKKKGNLRMEKRKKSFTLTPQPRPVQLPGGFKFSFPQDVYNDEFIAETLSGNAEIITGTTLGVNFQKYKRNYDYLKSSSVYQLIHEEDSDSDA